MNEQVIVAIAGRRGRTLDQPNLADRTTAQLAWEAWAPINGLLELPRDIEDLIDQASAELGHLTGGGRRRHAWRCAEAGAWGLAQPLPQLPDRFHRARRDRPRRAPDGRRTLAETDRSARTSPNAQAARDERSDRAALREAR